MAFSSASLAAIVLILWTTHRLSIGVYNLVFSPLVKYPGPRFAALSEWYRAAQEVFLSRSWTDVLIDLHTQYGEIVRVGPNELIDRQLHFSHPAAYREIYNNANRWDKDVRLYSCFSEDRSSFGYCTYTEAKARRDVLAPLFSRRAINDFEERVRQHMQSLCDALARHDAAGKSSDLLFALRCFTLDTILALCFAKSVNAVAAPDFQDSIVVAMDASLPAFVVFRHFEIIQRMVFGMPAWLVRLTNPRLAGLVDLQELLGTQVKEVGRNPDSLKEATHQTIYHRLLDPELNKEAGIPSEASQYEEAQALLFGGADSAANTAMVGTFHVLKNPAIHSKLKAELKTVWPDLVDMPKLETLEKLPYLSAVIKESLRIAPGVPSPLPRVVPKSGAQIQDETIPAGTVVGMAPTFVHKSAAIFEEPTRFWPERWLRADSKESEGWLVTFSRGPRSCFGQNLGMCELYLAFAALFRRFELELDGTMEENLIWKDAFLPAFTENHMRVFCRPVEQ